eukprot:TRINITY_DN41409_c0_g1_i1.p2 TRINITY_DN41409_c0_g1~~TRINITY_DN41409_c0_g1_i1.p2  ORF type:complete len:144 (+),score=39.51 TRINITY_DN41409_c0_g1_i1:37-468(+)
MYLFFLFLYRVKKIIVYEDDLVRKNIFFFKQKTAYEMLRSLVGSEMCIRDRFEKRQARKAEKARIKAEKERRASQQVAEERAAPSFSLANPAADPNPPPEAAPADESAVPRWLRDVSEPNATMSDKGSIASSATGDGLSLIHI